MACMRIELPDPAVMRSERKRDALQGQVGLHVRKDGGR